MVNKSINLSLKLNSYICFSALARQDAEKPVFSKKCEIIE